MFKGIRLVPLYVTLHVKLTFCPGTIQPSVTLEVIVGCEATTLHQSYVIYHITCSYKNTSMYPINTLHDIVCQYNYGQHAYCVAYFVFRKTELLA